MTTKQDQIISTFHASIKMGRLIYQNRHRKQEGFLLANHELNAWYIPEKHNEVTKASEAVLWIPIRGAWVMMTRAEQLIVWILDRGNGQTDNAEFRPGNWEYQALSELFIQAQEAMQREVA